MVENFNIKFFCHNAVLVELIGGNIILTVFVHLVLLVNSVLAFYFLAALSKAELDEVIVQGSYHFHERNGFGEDSDPVDDSREKRKYSRTVVEVGYLA